MCRATRKSYEDRATPHHGGNATPQWAWREDRLSKEDYSWGLSSYGIFLARFCKLLYLSPFPLLLFEMGMLILCLSHHCILEAHNLADFIGSELEKKFCLRMNHILSLTHTWLRWCLDQTLDLGLMLEWVKTHGDVGMEWMYFTCKENMNPEGSEDGMLWTGFGPPKIHILKFNLQYNCIWG